ncbi:hypothetical protein [Treponema brennaborense]|uniref:Major outer membrane protein n=1 Tax=Treponema brennaborense (strain DSM 12168 / CIP 105900 / DD5/3) TaxID=906968 RepID=F4LP01_TREBD|nr:hypothetical protein [Treponema brennaborense]AEE17978.1 hypothetical protein Trebr_2574 [Treponema brennaborense DSM 12168]
MVKNTVKKSFAFLSALVFAALASFDVCAETKIGAEISLNSGWMHIQSPVIKNDDFWYSSAQAGLKIDTALSSSVKAYLEGRVDITSVPELINPEAGNAVPAAYQANWTLRKAYMKFRLPCGLPAGEMRIAAGKMPLSWGYGLFYNAGDLIFGSDPLGTAGTDATAAADATSLTFSASSLSDFRTATDWIFALTVPLLNGIQIEVAALPPIETASTYGFGRFGGRVQFNTEFAALENIEAGYLAEGNAAVQKAYLSLDGNLWLDYNVNVSTAFKKDDGFDKDEMQCSVSLAKIFYIQTDVRNHQLQLRAESLWAPFTQKLGVFSFASYQITEKLSVSGTYLFCAINGTGTATGGAATGTDKKIEDNAHFAGIAIAWEPISALELSLEGMLNAQKADKLASVSAGLKYRY